MKINSMDYNEIMSRFQREEIIGALIKHQEHLKNEIFPNFSEAKGKIINEMIAIVDYEGKNFSLKNKAARDFLNLNKEIEYYYPDNTCKVFLINLNFCSKISMSMTKCFMNKKLKNKLVPLGKNYKSTLLRYISQENLPAIYGGTCNCTTSKHGCLNSNIDSKGQSLNSLNDRL